MRKQSCDDVETWLLYFEVEYYCFDERGKENVRIMTNLINK